MYRKLILCFKEQFFNKNLVFEIFEYLVKFKPTHFRKNKNQKEWSDNTDIRNIIGDIRLGDSLFIKGIEWEYFSVNHIGSGQLFFSIEIQWKETIPSEINLFISTCAKNIGFVSAYLVNAEYEYVQSSKYSSNFENRGFSIDILNSIKETPWQKDMWGGKEYNILFNPGRSVLTNHSWLMVGWEMWFGDPFFEYVDKNHLLAFPYAKEIKELDEKTVFVHLYEDIDKPFTEDAIHTQWKWREWLKFDLIEKLYSL